MTVDSKEKKLLMLDTLMLVIGECDKRGFDAAANHFSQVFISLVKRFLTEYPEEIGTIMLRMGGSDDSVN